MKEYARIYIHQWCGRLGVAHPEVKFRKMKSYGICYYTENTIVINKYLLDPKRRYDLEDTCRHEILHLINGTHNLHFLEAAQKLGMYRGETYDKFKKRFEQPKRGVTVYYVLGLPHIKKNGKLIPLR